MEVGLSVVTAFPFENAAASAGLSGTPTAAGEEFAFADVLPWSELPGNSDAETPASNGRKKAAQTPREPLQEPSPALSAWLGMLPVSGPPLLIPVDPLPPPQVGPENAAQANGDKPDALGAYPAVELYQDEAFQTETLPSGTLESTFQFELDTPVSSHQEVEGIGTQPGAIPSTEVTQSRVSQRELPQPATQESPAAMAPLATPPTLLSPVNITMPSVPVPGPIQPSVPHVTASRPPDSRIAESGLGATAIGPPSAKPPVAAAAGEGSGQRLPDAPAAPVETHQDVFRLVVQNGPAGEVQPTPPLDEPPLSAKTLALSSPSDEGVAGYEVPSGREVQGRAARPEEDVTGTPPPSSGLGPIWLPTVDRTERPLPAAAQSSSTDMVDTVNLPEPVGHPEEAPASAAVREVTLTQADGERVSLHLQQSIRGLEVRVAAADEGARQQLRAGLDELIERVEKQGLGSLLPSPANTGAADDREAGGRHQQPPEQEWEPRRSRRTRTTVAEGSAAFTALLGLGNTERKD